jgi:hypothetical protein
MVAQNPNKYSFDEWSEFDKRYRETGDYPLAMPPIKAQSLDMALEDNPVIGNEILGEPIPETRGNVKGFYEQSMSGTEEQARQRVKDLLLKDEAYTKDAVKQFTQLPEEEKMKYLDADKNGIISADEAKDFNPIIRWAQDTKWNRAVKSQKGTWKAVPGQSTAKGATDITSVVGKRRDIDPKYGNISRPNIYSLGGTVLLKDIPTTGAKLLDDTGAYDYQLKGNLAKAYLKDYDADKKTIIVQVTSKDPTSGIDTQQLLEIPQENIPNFQSIKIDVNGKQTTIGELKGEIKTGGELDEL